jgi:hypothetical protein
MRFGGLPPRSSGVDLTIIISCDGIPMVKSTCMFTKGSFNIDLYNTKLVGIDLLPCE